MSSAPSSWNAVIASSAVMSLALLGDALLYAVLPIHAAAFGISIAWVGILLSANRLIRVFVYGWIARLSSQLGARRLCLIAVVGAVVSTGMYGLAEGEWWLLVARGLWGLSYAALVLVTLAYAVNDRKRVGARVGWSRAIQRVGPILALVVGASAVAWIGPREIFVWLAVLTLFALPAAMSLPTTTGETETEGRAARISKPSALDLMFALQGAGVDGVFAISVTLLLAQSMPTEAALALGGTLLAMRHVGEAVASPIFGVLADRYGARKIFVASLILTAIGFAMVAIGMTVVGAIVLLTFRGALAVLGPALIVQTADENRSVMGDLANMQAWRDLGAAIGPAATGFALAAVSAEWLHGLVAVLIVLWLVAWRHPWARASSGN